MKVTFIREDWKALHVTMALRWFNRNYVGTHFGGSLYSMVDPHLMLLLIQLLGRGYIVWDQAAAIEFVKATRKGVRAVIKVSDADLAAIKSHTDGGEKYLAEFDVDIVDEDNNRVAWVKKTIYVRRKPQRERR